MNNPPPTGLPNLAGSANPQMVFTPLQYGGPALPAGGAASIVMPPLPAGVAMPKFMASAPSLTPSLLGVPSFGSVISAPAAKYISVTTTTQPPSLLGPSIISTLALQKVGGASSQPPSLLGPSVISSLGLQKLDEKHTTTVFVGNIAEKVGDSLIKQILMKCGTVISWKRVQGTHGRLQAFGFCEFIDQEAGLRAMRLLNKLQVGDKELLAKVDAKTKALLDQYEEGKKKQRAELSSTGRHNADEERKKSDQLALSEIQKVLQEHAEVLSGKLEGELPYMRKTHSGSADNLEGLDMDDQKRNLVSKEIRSFRESYKIEEDKEKERERRDPDRDRRERRERDRDRDREKERDRDKEKEADREEKDRRDRDKERDREREKRSSHYADDDRVRSRDKGRRARSGSPSDEDEREEYYERKRMERKLAEKENAFHERLRDWEARERQKAREYEKQFAKDHKHKEDMKDELTRLQEFLEEYDDDKDDMKYYRGSALARKLHERQLEAEADARDRQRELEQMESMHYEAFKEEPAKEHPVKVEIKEEDLPSPSQSISMTLGSATKEEELPREDIKSEVHNTTPAGTFVPLRSASPPLLAGPGGSPAGVKILKRDWEQTVNEVEVEASSSRRTFGLNLKLGATLQQSTAVNNGKKLDSVFVSSEDGAVDGVPRKRLTRLDDDETPTARGSVETNQDVTTPAESTKSVGLSADEKKKVIKNLIEKIPNTKDAVFPFPIKWDVVDQGLMDKRIRPWVAKKIFAYIGEDEPTLIDFICNKVISHNHPQTILDDIKMILDDEAEVFVVKLWRLLIYETEAKLLGIVNYN